MQKIFRFVNQKYVSPRALFQNYVDVKNKSAVKKKIAMDSYDNTDGVSGYYNVGDVSVSKSKRRIPCGYKIEKRVLGKPVSSSKRTECDGQTWDGKRFGCRIEACPAAV